MEGRKDPAQEARVPEERQQEEAGKWGELRKPRAHK